MITTDEKDRFLKWLTKAASYSAVPGIYASLSELDFYCRKRGILKKPLFETHDAVTLGRVRTVIGFDSDFRDAYRNKSKDILSAMQYYAYYVRSEGLEEPIPEDEDEAEKDETEETVEVTEEAVEEEGEEEEAAEQTVEETADVPEEEADVPEEEAEVLEEMSEEEAETEDAREEETPVEVPQAEEAEETPVKVPQEEAAEEAPVGVPVEAPQEEEEDYMPYKKPRAKRHRMEGQYYDWLSRLDRGGK